MNETREPLRRTFDSAANLYKAARPSYPDEPFGRQAPMDPIGKGPLTGSD